MHVKYTQYFDYPRPSERVSATQREVDVNNINEFNEWIADIEVEDLPCVGRKFT